MSLRKAYSTLLTVLVVVAIFPPFFIETFELKIYDLFTRYSAPMAADNRIVIVGIDRKSLDKFGRWPWPRDLTGKLIDKISGYGAKVIALDLTFSTEADIKLKQIIFDIDKAITEEGVDEKNPGFYEKFTTIGKKIKYDRALADSIATSGNVVSAFLFHGPDEAKYSKTTDEKKRPVIEPFRIKLVERPREKRDTHIWFTVDGVEPNIPLIQSASKSSGFINVMPDEDGVIRSHPMVIEYKGAFYPSLALAGIMLYSKVADDTSVVFGADALEGIRLGARFIPMDEHGFVMPKYFGPNGTFPVVSAADVINGELNSSELRSHLAGKIVLLGATATELYDLRVSPFGFTAGVEIQANAMASVLGDKVITKLGWQKIYDALIILALGFMLYHILKAIRAFLGLAFAATLFVGLIYFNFWIFSEHSMWLTTITPGLSIFMFFTLVSVYQYIDERKSKQFIQSAFGHYLSPKVINDLIENPELLSLGGEERHMTALFSDVAGFTTISEKLSPTELVDLLNEYLTAMSDIIHGLDGTIDKFEGDAIIVFWGAPIMMDDHASLCVLSAVRMQKKLVEMRKQWAMEGRDQLQVRIGINTGLMKVGNMGSKERMDYTIMGDSVNLAARLEGANKYYGSNILVTEFTRDKLKGKFLLRELDKVRVEGKSVAIQIFDVIDEMELATKEQIDGVKLFEEALAAFRALKLDDAKRLFKRCEGLFPNKSCELYMGRIARLKEMPMEMDWDATYDLAK